MGITERIGIFVLAVVPMLLAVFSSISVVFSNPAFTSKGATGFGKAHWVLKNTINNLSNGYGGFDAIDGQVDIGGGTMVNVVSTETRFGYLKIAATGFTMIVTGRVASKLTGGRARKIPFTNINAVGA